MLLTLAGLSDSPIRIGGIPFETPLGAFALEGDHQEWQVRRSLGWWGKVCGSRLDWYPEKMSLKMLGIVGLHIDFLEFLIMLYVSSTTPPGGDRPQHPSFQ